MKPRQTSFNKEIDKTIVTTTETRSINTKNGVVSVRSGDVILATICPDGPDDVLFKCRFVDVKDGSVSVYVLDPNFNLVDLVIKENRVVSVEKPN